MPNESHACPGAYFGVPCGYSVGLGSEIRKLQQRWPNFRLWTALAVSWPTVEYGLNCPVCSTVLGLKVYRAWHTLNP